MQFKDKTIIIVSQQDWGKMFISKHHYASELAKMGNRVYFMNAPEKEGQLKRGEVKIESSGTDNLYIIKHKLFYPYLVKFKAPALHKFLLRFHIQNIYRKIHRPVDVIWSFDVSDTIHLKSFPAGALKIFMPVDNPVNPSQEKRADVMFSVTREILDMYHCDTPKLFVNHGVAECFIATLSPTVQRTNVQVGISGNFLRPDIDWDCLIQIIRQNKDAEFNFWGAFNLNDGNLSTNTNDALNNYKQKLAGLSNVKLHGAVDMLTLSVELKKMDAFLICYDIERDQSNGTNYHKVLEYLASGKVIVSNNITTYQGSGLIEMPKERNNIKLPRLFADVMCNLNLHNSLEKQEQRINYAKEHTYRGNIRLIENFINEHNPAL